MYCVLSGVSAKQNNRNALRRLNTIPRIVLHTLQSFLCVFFFLSCVRLNQDANKAPEGYWVTFLLASVLPPGSPSLKFSAETGRYAVEYPAAWLLVIIPRWDIEPAALSAVLPVKWT